MKRLFIGLTLLLMAFLSSLDQLDAMHRLLARVGVQRWMTELLLAAAVAGAFSYTSQLHRRMLFPRRGLRLLLVGIAVYAAGFPLATGTLANVVGWLPLDESPFPRHAANRSRRGNLGRDGCLLGAEEQLAGLRLGGRPAPRWQS